MDTLLFTVASVSIMLKNETVYSLKLKAERQYVRLQRWWVEDNVVSYGFRLTTGFFDNLELQTSNLEPQTYFSYFAGALKIEHGFRFQPFV